MSSKPTPPKSGSAAAESRPTSAERAAQGKALRKQAPRSSHGDWSPPKGRPDPVGVITGQDADRLQWLVPIRHGRMAESPFAFYRGAAKIMASDLSGTPASGLPAQLCGDAHLANFGTYGSADRRQVFDVNDFDETLPGPWEWDLKRLATSFVLAGRDNGFDDSDSRKIAQASVVAYREAMATFAAARTMDVWYWQPSLDAISMALPDKTARRRFAKGAKKARSKDNLAAASKLTETVDGKTRINSDPPLLVPLRELSRPADAGRLRKTVSDSLKVYTASLQDDHRRLLDRLEIVDIALKVVGVGSVGTRCMIVLMQGRDATDPMFLQVKEATESVLESYLPKSAYHPHHGRRVVEGQRLTQASSDIFLGWSGLKTTHHYYWRQFHDMKGSADVAAMDPAGMHYYAALCGWTLAHAHARSGDAIAISGYLGSGDVFDRAIGDFAVAYADQNDKDHKAFVAAIKSGQVEAQSD